MTGKAAERRKHSPETEVFAIKLVNHSESGRKHVCSHIVNYIHVYIQIYIYISRVQNHPTNG